MSAVKAERYAVYESKLAPKHWQVCRLKDKATFNPSKSEIKKLPEVCTFAPMEKLKTDSLITDTTTIASETSGSYTYFKEEDILVAKVTPCFENRNIAIAKNLINGIGFGSSEINVVRVSKKANRRWFFYLLLSSEFIETGASKMAGAGGLKRIPSLFLETFSFALPPIPEQTAIAAYLDTKTAQIDRKIDLLSQKAAQYGKLKQSLINETVTRGLDKAVQMKASGVDWIGVVPEHWEIQRIGTAFEERSEKVNDTDYPPLSVSMAGIVPQMDSVAKTDNNDNRKRVAIGDYVINSRSDRRGASGISIYDGSVSVISIVLSPKRKFFGKYLHHLFRSYSFIEEFYRVGRGIVDDLWTTRYSVMKSIEFSYPTYDEQEQIADYLDEKTAHIDHIVITINDQIDQLKNLRKALINDVVTGKIKVVNQG